MKLFKSLAIGFLGALLVVPSVFARSANDPKANNWALNQIGATRAWEISTGSSDVVVAVIDNGFDYLHPELFPNTWKNEDEIANNGLDDDNNGYIDDVWGWDFSIVDRNADGDTTDPEDLRGDNNPRPDIGGETPGVIPSAVIHHGSVVAGIIGAKGNNGRNGSGVNWDVRLMNIRLIGNAGFAEQTAIADSIYYAVNNGADVINFSLVTEELGTSALQALKYAYEQDVVVVSAAGNDRMDLERFPYYPICADEDAAQQEILGVSAIQEGRAFAGFSNYGSNCIDITAPGAGLEGVLVYAPEVGFDDSYGGNWQGTSFAAPFVSGAAALVKSVQPTWGPDKIFETLQQTTSKSATDDEEGYQDFFGSGLLQLDKALEQALAFVPQDPQQPTTPEIIDPQTIPAIQTVSLSQGSSRLKNTIESGLVTIKESNNLLKIDDIARTTKNEEYIYATVQYHSEIEQITVQILDQNFELLDSFEKPAIGEYAVAIADFAPGFEGMEVALVPTHANDEIFYLYSQKGTLLESQSFSGVHQGAEVSVSYYNLAQIPQLVVGFRQESGVSVVQQYEANGDLVKDFTVQSVEGIGEIIAADIDGDGLDEYVVGSLETEPARLVYYDTDGGQLRKFLPYNGGERVRMNFDTADFNQDGKADILVSAQNSLHPVRVWTDKSKKLLTWYPVQTYIFPTKRFFFNN